MTRRLVSPRQAARRPGLRWIPAAASIVLAVSACSAPPLPSPTASTPTRQTLGPTVTSGPRSLDCDFLLSLAEVQQLIGARVESVQVSYGDGAGCQYQTDRGSANVIVFSGPVGEEMWGNRPAGSAGPAGPIEVNVVDGWPVGHVLGLWLTIRGRGFEVLSPEARIDLVTLLVRRLQGSAAPA